MIWNALHSPAEPPVKMRLAKLGKLSTMKLLYGGRGRSNILPVPVLIALRRHFEATRSEILTSNPQADASEATRLLINKLLHHPSRAIRELAGMMKSIDADGSTAHEDLVRRLFQLPIGEDEQ